MPRLWSRAAIEAPTPGTAVMSALRSVSTVWPADILASKRVVFCGGFTTVLFSGFVCAFAAVISLLRPDLLRPGVLEPLLSCPTTDCVGGVRTLLLLCPCSRCSNSLSVARAARRLAARCIGSCWRYPSRYSVKL